MRAFLVALFYAGAAGYRAPAARPRRGPRPLTMVLERARPDVSDKTGFVGLPGLRVQGLELRPQPGRVAAGESGTEPEQARRERGSGTRTPLNHVR